MICGFPGETEGDVEVLRDFLVAAELDVIGVFGYSDEDGTEAAGLDGHLAGGRDRTPPAHLADLADELIAQRAEARIGSVVRGAGRGARRSGGRSAGLSIRVRRWTGRRC